MTSGIPGSDYTPRPLTLHRLAVWRQYATAGHPLPDIAARLGMSPGALDQMLVRARRRGDPNAVHHARTGRPGGTNAR
jgi:hypothetical protein